LVKVVPEVTLATMMKIGANISATPLFITIMHSINKLSQAVW